MNNLDELFEEYAISTDEFDEDFDDGLAEIDIEFAMEIYGNNPEFIAYLERLNAYREARRDNMQKIEEMKILLGLEDYEDEESLFEDDGFESFELEIKDFSYTLKNDVVK